MYFQGCCFTVSSLFSLRVVNRQEDAASEEITPTDLFVALRSQGFVLTGEEQGL